MVKAPELPKTATTQPEPVPEPAVRDTKPSGPPTQIICDIADGNAFVEEYRKPHIPVMSAFGVGRLHACRLFGSWDLDRMARDNAGTLFRSIRKLPTNDAKEAKKEWDDLTFKFGSRSFLYADKDRIIGFAATAAEAERVYRADLRRWPRNGWALFGLMQSLEAQGKGEESAQVRRQFAETWKHADVEINSSCFCQLGKK